MTDVNFCVPPKLNEQQAQRMKKDDHSKCNFLRHYFLFNIENSPNFPIIQSDQESELVQPFESSRTTVDLELGEETRSLSWRERRLPNSARRFRVVSEDDCEEGEDEAGKVGEEKDWEWGCAGSVRLPTGPLGGSSA